MPGFAMKRELMEQKEYMLSSNSKQPLAASESLSDEEEEESEDNEEYVPSHSGSLYKWTNYIHGWQPRYFLLQDGTLAYYKSEQESGFGCRGAVPIEKAVFQAHEFDDCRFEICVNDNIWYLRAENTEERQNWIDTLEAYKAESGYGSQNDLRRHGSLVSLTSNRSMASTSSFKSSRGLKEKLAELETFRDIVCRQIESLQGYFDACAANIPSSVPDQSDINMGELDKDEEPSETDARKEQSSSFFNQYHESLLGIPALDFKGEALTFKATTAGILTTLQHCIDLMQQREEIWRKRVEKEVERRKRIEEQYKTSAAEVEKLQAHKFYGGPDYEEGPNSTLNEEEWHDAVDAALDREDIEDNRGCLAKGTWNEEKLAVWLMGKSGLFQIGRLLSREGPGPPDGRLYQRVTLSVDSSLFHPIDNLTLEQLTYAKAGVAEGLWELFAEDGEMKMFKREVEIDGVIVDPLKAVHSVKGVTAHEYCHYFFAPEYKLDWDSTLDDMKVVERFSEDTIVFHQVHKRVWPANQRESLFWSHIRRMDSEKDPDAHDLYIVCNHDTEREDVPVNSKCLRVGLTISMVCQTVINRKTSGRLRLDGVKREDLTCKILYVAHVNPGGWAPASALRLVYKREYPKFLKRFTQYVLQKTGEQKSIKF